ncbi:MAG TPA: response regulator, partial [Marinagarivorans sp.]
RKRASKQTSAQRLNLGDVYQPSRLAAMTKPPISATTAPRILFIDDTPSNLRIAEAYLETWDCSVHCAVTGHQGIAVLERETIDIVFLDIEMPGLNGYQTAKRLRQNTACPLIAMTGHDITGIEAQLRASGFNGYLAKPFDEQQLLASLRAYCAKPIRAAAQVSKPSPAPLSPPVATPNQTQQPDFNSQNILDIDGLYRRVRGNRALADKILASFASNNTGTYTAFCKAINRADWETATRIAHTLKGGGANIGATALATMGSALEAICQNQQHPTKAQLLALNQQLNAVLSACHDLLENYHMPAPTHSEHKRPADITSITSDQKAVLKRILRNLDNDIGLAQDELDALDSQQPNNADIQDMLALFNQFELDKLANKIENYLQNHSP